LVVIAIIAILAAILFPVFARARENARRASCQSNLKQIGLGIMQYAQDYDEKFPLWYADNGGTVGSFDRRTTGAGTNPTYDQGWAELIQPYVKSTQILQCPSESTAPAPAGSNSYGYSDYASNLSDINAYTGMVGLVAPSQTVLALDFSYIGTSSPPGPSGDSSSTIFAYWSWAPTPDTGQVDRYHQHLGGDNILFCDGHVKWLKPQMIKARTTGDPCGTGNSGSPQSAAYTFCPN
jgi:prepilin-type processing-associated H-X9-DG protein